MKNRKNTFKRMSAVMAAGLLCCVQGLTASAITADDVAERARRAGYSEEMIQRGYNEWSTGMYSEEDLWKAYNAIGGYEEAVDEKIDEIFDVTPAPETPAENNASPETPKPQQPEVTPAPAPTEKSFVNMTLEEKIAYVSAMTEQQKNEFLQNLSPAERNSIIKQMSVSDKTDIMQGYVDAAASMNMNLVVDSLTNDGIGVTIRDKDGVIVDQAAVGLSIDETGISHTRLIVLASSAILLAFAGFAWIFRRMHHSAE